MGKIWAGTFGFSSLDFIPGATMPSSSFSVSSFISLTWSISLCNLQKRARDEEGEGRRDPVDMLRTVGEVGKGFVRGVYLLKAPRLMN